jgi:Ca-activated chloride channel family protein
MNTRLITFFLLFVLLISACAPAAAPTPIAVEPRSNQPAREAPVATEAPAAEIPAPMPTMVYDGNYYQDPGVNPEQRARRDHLSTFSLDVDTAAYSEARRYIRDGSLPPYEAVRAEEFINAFDQGYERPYNAAFAIYADGAPSPFQNDDTYFLRVGIQGYDISEEERKPLVLTFVIDVSGSMSKENRLQLVKDALEMLVERLGYHDTVTVVVYGSDARLQLEPTPGDEHDRIIRTIKRLRTEGSTNAEAGLRLGYRYAMENYDPGASNRVILCSDGVANTGQTSVDALLNMVGGYVAEGIDLTSIGVGMGNYNDVLLEQLADRGNGNYVYVDTLEEARKVFVDDLTSTLQVIAYDAKVQVDFNSELVSEYRLIGYENREIADQDFRDDTVDAGEIGPGHTATAVYQVRLAPGAEGRIATVQLRWQDADTREVREINGNFNTWDLYSSYEESDPYYQTAVLVAQYAEVLRASPYAQASLSELARMANQLARSLRDEAVQEFAQLVREAAWITGQE